MECFFDENYFFSYKICIHRYHQKEKFIFTSITSFFRETKQNWLEVIKATNLKLTLSSWAANNQALSIQLLMVNVTLMVKQWALSTLRWSKRMHSTTRRRTPYPQLAPWKRNGYIVGLKTENSSNSNFRGLVYFYFRNFLMRNCLKYLTSRSHWDHSDFFQW